MKATADVASSPDFDRGSTASVKSPGRAASGRAASGRSCLRQELPQAGAARGRCCPGQMLPRALVVHIVVPVSGHWPLVGGGLSLVCLPRGHPAPEQPARGGARRVPQAELPQAELPEAEGAAATPSASSIHQLAHGPLPRAARRAQAGAERTNAPCRAPPRFYHDRWCEHRGRPWCSNWDGAALWKPRSTHSGIISCFSDFGAE